MNNPVAFSPVFGRRLFFSVFFLTAEDEEPNVELGDTCPSCNVSESFSFDFACNLGVLSRVSFEDEELLEDLFVSEFE